MQLKAQKKAVIFELAWAWDVTGKIKKRRNRIDKYLELAADLANQWLGYRVEVIPVVLGNLGLTVDLKKHLRHANILASDPGYEASQHLRNHEGYAKRNTNVQHSVS